MQLDPTVRVRNRNRKKKPKGPAFAAIFFETLNSLAYKELPYAAAKAYPYFISKVKMPLEDPQRYALEFSFSYSEAKRYGFAPATFSKAIQALVAHGLIDPIDKGGLRSNGKSLNKFSLSQRWKDYGKPEFKALNWKCFQPKPRLKPNSKTETYRFKNGNKHKAKGIVISKTESVGAVSP